MSVCGPLRSLFVFSEYLVMVIEFQIIAMSYIRKGETPGICRSSFFDFPPRFSYAKSFFFATLCCSCCGR